MLSLRDEPTVEPRQTTPLSASLGGAVDEHDLSRSS
jgi:hypothetical protein